MASQFFGLNTAYTGLTAANAALNTTANNISNIETKGYSRQQVTQQAADAIRTFTTYGCAGAGVETLAIERIRDDFYDVKYWNNNSSVGEYDTKYYYMKQIEDYFRDDKTIEGFNTIFDKMYAALGQLQSDASDITKRSEFVGFANNLASYFNNLAENMERLQSDVNSEIKIKADKINSLSSSIAALNKQINVIEVGGGTANELRDQRAVLLDELSSIVDIKITETPVKDLNNEGRLTGASNFRVEIAGGQILIDNSEYNTLVCVGRESYEKVNQTDVDGLYDLYWSKPGEDFDKSIAPKFNIYSGNLSGELKALVQLRDGNNGESFRGKVESLGTTTIDGTDYSTVKVGVNASFLQDIKKLNLSDTGGVINLGNTLFYYDSWTMEEDADGNVSFEFVLSDSEKNAQAVQNSCVGKEASIGNAIAYQGIPYYQQQMNEWVRCFAESFNNILTGTDENPGIDANGDIAKDLFVANGVDGNQQYITSDKNMSYLTAKNFAVSKEILQDASKFATHTGASDGEGKSDIIDALIDLKTNKNVMSFRGASASEFLQGVLTDITLATSHAKLFKDNYSNLQSSIETQRQSISGVDKDEEAINLVKYQNAYTLSSKMIQVLTEVYDRLILSTGV